MSLLKGTQSSVPNVKYPKMNFENQSIRLLKMQVDESTIRLQIQNDEIMVQYRCYDLVTKKEERQI